ncbi:hypothetical protein TNCV_373851 [Trichonephila clavipes]|nr:hypothetical protein TNCV_373851 [Trichonephila clavipes]
MWNPQKAGYLLRNILGSKVVKTNLKEDFHINCSVTNDSLRWRAIHRLGADQSKVEMTRWLQVTGKLFPCYGINSKQVVLSPGRSRQKSPQSIDTCTGSLR